MNLDKFLIKLDDYNPEFKSANQIINHYWLTNFTNSVINLYGHLNHMNVQSSVTANINNAVSLQINNNELSGIVKYIKKDKTLTIKESTFGDVLSRPRIYIIPMIIQSNNMDKLVIYMGDVQKMADCRSSVPSTLDSSTGKNKTSDRTYSFSINKLNECILGALFMKDVNTELMNGLIQFYNTTTRMYSFYYKQCEKLQDKSSDKSGILKELYDKIVQITEQFNKFISGYLNGDNYKHAA